MAPAIVQVEGVGLAVFVQDRMAGRIQGGHEPVTQFRSQLPAPVCEFQTREIDREIFDGLRPVIRDVQIEIAIQVNVRKGQRHGSVGPAEPGVQAFLEFASTDIDEASHSPAHRTDEQIQVAVAINVGERRAG